MDMSNTLIGLDRKSHQKMSSPLSPKNSELDFIQQCRRNDKACELGIHTLNDIEIVRIYQAAHGDAVKALIEVHDLLTWRRDIKYDEVLNNSYPAYCNSILYHYGFTATGSPVLFYKAKNHLPLTDDVDVLVKQSISLMGNIQRKHNYPKVILCFDRDGATKDNVNLTLAKQVIALFTKYFPETLQELLVYQSNFLIWSMWSILKPFMDPDTVKKVDNIYIGCYSRR